MHVPAAAAPPPPARAERLGWGSALLALYVLADVGARAFAAPAHSASVWYPSAGVGLVLLAAGGWRWAPALWLARVGLHLLAGGPDGGSAFTLLVFPTLAVAAYGLAAHVARRCLPAFGTPWSVRDVVVFGALALLTPVALGLAVAGAFTAVGRLPGPAGLGTYLLRYAAGDAVGLVLFVPFAWHWLARPLARLAGTAAPAREQGGRHGRSALPIALGQGLALVGAVAVAVRPGGDLGTAYLCFVPMVWLALERGIRGAALGTLLLSTGVALRAAWAHVPAGQLAELVLFELTLFLGGLLLGASVSARRRAARARLEAEARYRHLLETANEGVWTLDREGRVDLVNPALAHMLGCAPHEVLGRPAHALVQPGSREALARGGEARLRGQSDVSELVLRHKDGHPVRVLMSAAPLRDARGEVVGTIGMATDVTALREVQAAAARAEALLATALRASRDAVSLYRLDDERLLAVNDALCRMTGYAREELVGQTREGVNLWEDERDAERFTELLRTRGAARDFEFYVRRKDGARRLVLAFAEALEVDGRPCALVIARDVTDERREEAQTRHTHKLEELGRVVGNIAHDFNNVLAAITAYGQRVADALPGDDPRSADMAEVLRAAERAAALTGQLLAFSRVRVAERRPVALNDVVQGVVGLLKPLVGRNVEVHTRLEPGLPPVQVDRGQVEQCVMNLAVNARDAMPEGGLLTLSTGPGPTREVEGRPQHFVSLTVSDSGEGMDEATQARIFEPFFTTKPLGQGTGLGLPIVQRIVRQSGGWLELDSAPGLGTRFRLYWPVAEQVAEAPGAPAPAPEPTPALEGGPLRVLLAEDEPALRAVVRRTLEGLGCRVIEARDGEEALEVLERTNLVDLLLTDVVMPRLGGRALAERARALHPGLAVLFLSGYADSPERLEGLSTVPPYVLPKPFTPEALRRAVVAAYQERQRRDKRAPPLPARAADGH